jgi:hypothetical protein
MLTYVIQYNHNVTWCSLRSIIHEEEYNFFQFIDKASKHQSVD